MRSFLLRLCLMAALFTGALCAQTYTFSSCKNGVTMTVKIDTIISQVGPFQSAGGHSTQYLFYGDFTLTVNGSTQTQSSVLSAGEIIYNPNSGGNSQSSFFLETADQAWQVDLQGPGDLIPGGVFPTTLPALSNWTVTAGDDIRYGTLTNGTFVYVDTLGQCGSSGTGTIAITNVISAGAFGGFTIIAPGTWIEIYGTSLTPDTRTWTTADFNGSNAPTSLDGVQVTINGENCFVSYIGNGSPSQVNVQVPYDIPAGTASVVVSNNGLSTQPYSVTVAAIEPGLLAPATFNLGGDQYVAALLSDGSAYILPTGAIAGVTSRPAKPGDEIVLYGIGFGPVLPNYPAGEIIPTINVLASPAVISIGGVHAPASYEGLAPGQIGLYQLNVTVPQAPNNLLTPLTVSVNGVTSSQTLYIPISQ